MVSPSPLHVPRWRALISLVLLAAAASAPAATITVNSSADTVASDTYLTFREALKIAEGTLGSSSAPLTTEEKNQVSGVAFLPYTGNKWVLLNGQAIGAGKADTIIFDKSVGTIMIQSALSSLQPEDSIDGSVGMQRVILDGSQGGNIGGLTADKGVSVSRSLKNLILRNFAGDAIRAVSETNGFFSNLEIYGNGGKGIYLQSTPRYTQITGCRIYNNAGSGIQLEGSATDSGTDNLDNTIDSSIIGLDSTYAAQGNKQNGIVLLSMRYTTVDSCVISANLKDGIQISGTNAFSNQIESCTIGLNPGKSAKLGNGLNGITLLGGAHDNTIGGIAADNYIAGSINGIFVSGNHNYLLGNVIGISSGGAALGNTSYGIRVTGSNNFIGDTSAGNTICASGTGVSLEGNNNQVLNSYIGTTKSGKPNLGNATAGIYISGNTNKVGGSTMTYGNVISGNDAGIIIEGSGAFKNTVYQNDIGTGENGVGAIPNVTGVILRGGAFNNEIGAPSQGNTIAGNSGDGVYLKDGATAANLIDANTIGGYVGNDGNGIKIENSMNNKIGLRAGNIIGGNFDGVQITGILAQDTLVTKNIIGLNANQTTGTANRASGVSLLAGASHNTIGGTTASDRNVIAGNQGCGIYISDAGTQSNQVWGNLIGTNDAGAVHMGNSDAGVGIYNGASLNAIGGTGASYGNVIVGNQAPGVDIANSGTTANTVQGNKIGTNAAGTAANPNSGGGLRLFGQAANNTIGGSTAGQENLISGNATQGVGIYNTGTTGNQILNNKIGVNAAGTAALPNGSEGIVIQEGAASNTVRGNLISGNRSSGVNINGTGTNNNALSGNTIGLNLAGTAAIDNPFNGVRISGGAKNNLIGEAGKAANVISGNGRGGIEITGAGTSGNVVFNCVIGLNLAQNAAVGNAGEGVKLLSGASGNTVGGKMTGSGTNLTPANIIAGNHGEGVYLGDPATTNNAVYGNHIGINKAQQSGLGNLYTGILVDGAQLNIIGGAAGYANLVCNNDGPGIGLTGGASSNVVLGNQIGCTVPDQNGVSKTAPNQGDGVIVNYGATKNIIGCLPGGVPNLVSGNAGAGVAVDGYWTSGTIVMNNVIGLAPSGTATLPNQGDGVIISDYATCTTVQGNTIGGNGGSGVKLYGHDTTPKKPDPALKPFSNTTITSTAFNRIIANKIGTLVDGKTAAGNNGHGVLITRADMNTIGDITASLGNVIAFNGANGVTVLSGRGDAIESNSIHDNGKLGIDLGNDGVDKNDAGDGDSGPNMRINAPEALRLHYTGWDLLVMGVLSNLKGDTYRVELFANDKGDASGCGEGQTLVGVQTINLTAASDAYFAIHVPKQYLGKVFSATVTDSAGNTSEFSRQQANSAREWREYR